MAIWQQQTLLAATRRLFVIGRSGRHIRDRHIGPAELAASAIGFLVQIQTDKFSFITVFLNLLVSLIEPLNKQLQADALDVPTVTRMINAV